MPPYPLVVVCAASLKEYAGADPAMMLDPVWRVLPLSETMTYTHSNDDADELLLMPRQERQTAVEPDRIINFVKRMRRRPPASEVRPYGRDFDLKDLETAKFARDYAFAPPTWEHPRELSDFKRHVRANPGSTYGRPGTVNTSAYRSSTAG